MTNEELKKMIDYQSQLAKFALSFCDEVKDDLEWQPHAVNMLLLSYRMMKSLEKEFGSKGEL